MPYFNNNKDINLLLIHIPKTGGSSLEKYFSNKYNIPLNQESLFGHPKEGINNISRQHLYYKTIMEFNGTKFNINLNNLKKLTIVRNPYTRVISDLFFIKLININSSRQEIYYQLFNNYIKQYNINNNAFDHHVSPQYLYLMNEQDKIANDIKILKMENLNNSMINLGYEDFDIHALNSKIDKNNIRKYLNNMSIQLINDFYHFDFHYFKYNKINVNSINLHEEINNYNSEIIKNKINASKNKN
jgi:hypothetical protein